MTQEDLHAFQARTFGVTTFAAPIPFQPDNLTKNTLQDPGLEEWNDDLGYYPDGNKRTLTDDQIAMFRHSEIYSIIRERQIRKENIEAEGGELPTSVISSHKEDARAVELPDAVGDSGQSSDDEEEYVRFLEAEQKDLQATAASRKRRRHNAGSAVTYNTRHTSRRIARELDELTAEEQMLDYGDEPSPQRDLPTTASKHEGTKITPPADAHERGSPIEGKKIWWPVIGT